uniref:T9SS type B sorting domain-containing protein n=1 Tax=uncultured Tenacibaculum sp. TaxID=174713 RepID=UPI002614DE1E
GATNIITSSDGDVIGFTVPGEGVWSYNEVTGEISFDPEDGFTGDPTVITYNVSDDDGNQIATPANINIEYLDTAPVATNDINPVPTDIGDPTQINILTNDQLGDGTTPDVSDVTVDLDPGTPGVQTSLAVTGEGTWMYDSATGVVTFTPEVGFELSPTPITYELVDLDTGASDTATITVIYEIPPVADNELSTGNNQGDIVSVNILDGDTDADGTIDATSVNLVVPAGATNVITDLSGDIIGFTVPGEGTWSYDEVTGELSFDPEDGFTGNPTPVSYTVRDDDGNVSNEASVTIEYSQDPPVAMDDSSTGNDTGNPVTLDALLNDTLPDGTTPDPDDVIFDFVVPAGSTGTVTGAGGNTIEFTVPGEGTWLYDEASGEVTFTPESGFTDDPTPVDYNLTDVDTGEVTTSPGTITIDYEIEFPISEDDESLNNATGSTASIDILANDNDPDGNLDPDSVNLITPAGATNIVTDADGDVIGFDVPGEGTWSYDPVTGELTFTPESGFVEDPTPISYTVDDNDGNTSNPSTVTVDYVDVADLSLTKIVVDGDTTPLVGSEITFQITVTNDGPQNATGVEVTDLLPSGYDFILFSSTEGTYEEATGVWQVGSIPAGESETLLIDVLVNPTGDYLNIAQVTASDVFDIDSVPNNDDGDQSEDDEDNAIVTPVISIADLSLTKIVVDGDTTPLVGSEITFQITLTNDGPQDATGVEVTDLLPSGYDFVLFSSTEGAYNETTGVWTVGNVASGTSETLLIDVLVNPTGDYLNIAQVTASDVVDADSTPNNDDGDQSEDDEDSAITTPVISIADLSLTKAVVDGDVTPLVGDEITFVLTVRNDGPQTATGVEVTDLLPSGYDFQTFSSSTGTYNETTGVWTVGNLANGDVETLLIDVRVNPRGDYLNTAEVSASNVTDSDSTPGNSVTTEDDYAEALTTPIQKVADLSISKTTVGGITSAQPGDPLRFQITVSNAGPDNASNVQVSDLLPVGFVYDQFSATSGSYDAVTGLWEVDDIPANGSQTLFIDVIVNTPSNTTDEFVNRTEIVGVDQIDPDSDVLSDASVDDLADGLADDDETSFTVLVGIADLSLTKSVNNVNANVGEVVTFTLQVDNLGPDTATGVDLQDVLPIGYSNIDNISDGGVLTGNTIDWNNLTVTTSGLTITYEATVNMPTLQPGEYENVAQIIGSDQFDPNSTPNNDDGDQSENDESSATINTPTADISVSKEVDVLEPAIGDIINFTITVTNEGSIAATSVEISELLPSGYEYMSSVATEGSYDQVGGVWTIPSVPTGAIVMLEIEVKVLDISDYENTASLQSLDQIDGNPNNDSNSATIDPICLTIHDKFSPNGNADNEVFYIDCIGNYPKNKLEVYNRWGNIVYSKEGYDNTFDGISNGRAVINKGERLPVGTYYYVLDLGDGSDARVGWLYIVR